MMAAGGPGAAPDIAPACRITAMGSGACLLDAAGPIFDDAVQRRIWAVARDALAIEGVAETVSGMNNLMVVFDPLRLRPSSLEQRLRDVWAHAAPDAVAGRTHHIPVNYGGAGGEDLAGLAERTGLPIEEVVRRHAAATYSVAAVGAMPGFPYLSGLDPSLVWGRRSSPRPRVAEGAVIIGAAQAAVMPVTAPSGWHILGHTEVKMFDRAAADPVVLRAGDTVRFTVAGIER